MKKILALTLILLTISSASFARKVTGTVTCQDKTLANVLVTDGFGFAQTDSQGRFKLKVNDAAEFVYVITPSGYTVDCSTGTPLFYKTLTDSKKYDFDLKKTSDEGDFTLFSISDPQSKTQEHFDQFSGKPLNDLKTQAKKYSSKNTTAAIALGDIGWDSPEIYPQYKAAVAGIGIPVYPVIGNHDYDRTAAHEKVADKYRASFGPENYAFHIGNSLVICLTDIMYEQNKHYKEGYSDIVLDWVSGLLEYIPETTRLFIAQHSPLHVWSRGDIINADEMLSILNGRKVDFLSGHTHIQDNFIYTDDIMEHNAPSICGGFWKSTWCQDGTPRGYEILSMTGDSLSWFLHPIDYPDDYQVEMLKPGQSKYHPNNVVANVWDYDPQWKIEWWQDGKPMGEMLRVKDVSPTYFRGPSGDHTNDGVNLPFDQKSKAIKNDHYFVANPSQYSSEVKVKVTSRFGKEWDYTVDMNDYIDVQAHRGGAGLKPENTYSSMINAVKLGVNTLEMDLQMSKDSLVVVSHDAYFHSRYATRPDGSVVEPQQKKEYLFTMPYDSIAKYDVGLRKSTVWPEKAQEPAIKPLATSLIDSVESFTERNGYSKMRYNVEIKTRKGKGEGANWPEYKTFVDHCVAVLLSKHLGDRLVVQSFDTRALNYMHEKYPELMLSYLVDSKVPDFDTYMGQLDFVPEWLSPEGSLVTKSLVEKCHSKNIKIVPWTVDDPADIQKMVELDVDAIISNYPDRVLKITRGF